MHKRLRDVVLELKLKLTKVNIAAIFIKRDLLEGEAGSIQPVNREGDCLISSATVTGYSAIRSQSEGEWLQLSFLTSHAAHACSLFF